MKRLYRSETNRMLVGVLGGIGEYFNIDATIVRLIFIVLLLMSVFTVSILYLVAVMIIPNEGEVHK